MIKDFKTYRKLFTSTFYLSMFTFGGGFVMIPLMKKKFVDNLNWLEENEMLDLAAIAQSSPGAIAVNASILLGYRIAGFLGAVVAILGTILPPLIILSIVSAFYTQFKNSAIIAMLLKGMQAAVAAVIFDVVINMGGHVLKEKQFLSIGVMIGAFIATYIFKVNVMYIIIICGILGIISTYYQTKFKSQEKGAAINHDLS